MTDRVDFICTALRGWTGETSDSHSFAVNTHSDAEQMQEELIAMPPSEVRDALPHLLTFWMKHPPHDDDAWELASRFIHTLTLSKKKSHKNSNSADGANNSIVDPQAKAIMSGWDDILGEWDRIQDEILSEINMHQAQMIISCLEIFSEWAWPTSFDKDLVDSALQAWSQRIERNIETGMDPE